MKEKFVTMSGLVVAGTIMLTMLVSVPPAPADLPFETYFATFQQGVDGYMGTHDCWLLQRYNWNDEYANTGGMEYLHTHGHGTGSAGFARAESLIKFDDVFGPGGVPAGVAVDDIISATLTMTVYSSSATDPAHDLRVFAFITPWEAGRGSEGYWRGGPAVEGESTSEVRFYREDGDYAPEDYWGATGEPTNYPTMDDAHGELHYADFLDSQLLNVSGSFGEDAWAADLDVTVAVQGWLDGSIENHGFWLRSQGGHWAQYSMYSSNFEGNAEWRPKLTIEYIPEPGSLLLLAAGSLLALMRRRR